MKIKKREVVIVLGRTGQGKSIWSRQFMHDKKRLLVYDPLKEANVDYLSTAKLIEFAEVHPDKRDKIFRYGTANPDDVPLLDSCAYGYGDCWLFLEEASVVFPANSRSPEWIRNSIFLGRHRNLSIIVTAQRPTSIPVDLRSQASRIICFSQHEKNDVSWLGNYFSEQTDEIADLMPLECLDSDGRTVKKYDINPSKDDQKKYVNESGYF